MPSIGTYVAQPPTRSFVMTQDSDNAEWGAYYFPESLIESWIVNNSLVTVGRLVTIPSANFSSVMDDLTAGGITPRFSDRKTLLDMGTEYVIGDEINSRIIVLRKVLGQENASVGALGGQIGFICVENDSFDPSRNSGRFTVRVARV